MGEGNASRGTEGVWGEEEEEECSYTKATPGCGGGRAEDEGEDGFIHPATLDPTFIACSSCTPVVEKIDF